MTAAIRGPYCTGASAPCGAAALVRCPQPHSRSISWCSVTSARTGCRSKTWRRSSPVTGRPPARRRTGRSSPAHGGPPGPAGPPAPASSPYARPARRACDRSSSAASASAPAWPAPHSTAAWRSSAGSAAAGPQAQRSAPGPAQLRPRLLHRGCRPGQLPAQRRHQRGQHLIRRRPLSHWAHPDLTRCERSPHPLPPRQRAG